MYKKLVPFDGTRFLEVDKVALARTARALAEYLPPPDVEDSYGVYGVLVPLLEKAANGDLDAPIMERRDILDGRYFYERGEGELPSVFTGNFNAALSRFLVRVMAMPLDTLQLETVDGKAMAWVEFEEPGDWPDKVKHQ